MLAVGDLAPDVRLAKITGEHVSVAQTWRSGRHTLLIFLRHLGWLPCREHVAQLRSYYDHIKALNTEVIVVSFETGYWLQVWQAETEAPFPLLLDPDRQAYRAYGLGRSLLHSWGPKNLWYYFKALIGGQRTHRTGGDTGQLGGDFIVDVQGIIRLAHPSQNPTDRPPVAELLAVLTQL